MKNIYKLLKIFVGIIFFVGNTIHAQATYCVPTYSGWAVNEPVEPITLVQFGTGAGSINNPSSAIVSTTTPRYEDFSSISMDVQRGQTYDLKVKGNTNGNFTNYITIYFDWNSDGTFSNATPANAAAQQVLTNQPEKHQYTTAIVNSTGSDNIEMLYTVTIPTDAVLGQTRMRIVKNMNAPSSAPCANPFFPRGQVEDYTLNITNGSTIPITCTDPGLNPGDTGCVTFTYNGASVTYTTVRGADGEIWLQQNLGSTQVATSASDTASYGDYFQWGRWVDGHQIASSILTSTPPTPNNPSGISNGSTAFYSAAYNSANNWWSAGTTTDTWSATLPSSATSTDGCDPCKAIGTGWRLPTITEIGTMITSENLSNVGATGAFASNLKIPSSGIKDYNGMFSQGTRAYFWSSTPIYTGSAESFYSGTAVTIEGYVGRDSGIPIRCIYQAAVNVNTVNVTTQNNVSATINAANGTLQLEAAITPTTANQSVTWSVQSGNTSATVDNAGLVTGLTNGTAVIRATSLADPAKFGELTVTVNIPTVTPCTALQTFLETFDTFTTFPENCWTANYPNYPTVDLNGTTNKAVQLYSGNQPNDIILVSPEVSTINGQHQLVFDIVSTNGTGTTVQIGTMTDNSDFSTFAAVGTPFTPTVGSYSTQAIPANAGHKYVAIRYIHGGGHGKFLVVDNVEWKQVTASNDKFDADKVKIYPNPTTGMLFIDTEIDVKSIEIYNTSGQRILKTDKKNINLENAANGLYVVNVYATDGTHASYKIIKK